MSITELPIELILEIASYLDFEDPAPTQFALTCRHIYGIMMPQILADQAEHVRTLAESTYNITVRLSPYKEEVIASSFGLGIGIEPFGGPYRKVEFCVGHNIKDIRCVRGLITHARQLEHVVLNFSRYSSLRKLAVTIDFCVQRPNLSLTVSGNLPDICHGDYGRGPFDFKVEKIKPQIPLVETQQVFVEPRKAKRGILVRIMYPFLKFLGVFAPNSEIKDPMPSSSPTISSETTISAIPRRPTVHLALSHEPQLSSFSIESNTLFLPSFYPLTRDLLNMAPITTLSLAHITLHLFDWAQILPSITMPALTNLSIGVKLSIAFPDLLAFLERHESIRILDLTDNEAIGPVKLPPKPILLQLTSLTGNSEYLLPFIQSQRRGNFSLLRRLFLRTPKRTNLHDPLQSHYQYPGDRPIYDLMIHSQYKSRALNNLTNNGFIEWIINTFARWPTPHQFPHLEELTIGDGLQVSVESMSALSRWINDNCPSWSASGERPTDGFSHFLDPESQFVERFIWYIFPELKILQLGLSDEPEGRPTSRFTRPDPSSTVKSLFTLVNSK